MSDLSDEQARRSRRARLAEPADWRALQAQGLVGTDSKMSLPPEVMKAIAAPLQSALSLLGDSLNSVALPEDCTADQLRARGVWHALHYVTRRLSGWDELPADFFEDSISWEHTTQMFRDMAGEAEGRRS